MKVGDLVKYKPNPTGGVPTIVGIVLGMLDSQYVDVCFTWDGESYTKQVHKRDLRVISHSHK